MKKKRIFLVVIGVIIISLIYTFHPIIRGFFIDGVENNYTFGNGYTDDVSKLNKTKINKLIHVSSNVDSAELQLKQLVAYAQKNKLPVSIAGAKHSMGGHTIAPEGIVIDMLPFKKLSIDTHSGVLKVGSGALWSDVIPYLNKYNRAVSVMQSDNAFSVGGSISVNCHGWQHNHSPIASTIVAFRILTSDGKIVNCSRTENKELFSLALGGYGLFGIILEVEIQTVPNEVYSYHRILMSSEKYLDYFDKNINQNALVRMAYGRLNVDKQDFLKKAMLNFFIYEDSNTSQYPLSDPGFKKLKSYIFLGSKEDDYGKRFRWNSEHLYTKSILGTKFSRNQIMNESPSFYLNTDPGRTDILHEYFIPKRNFNLFIKELQSIVPRYNIDLLNITIRNVYEDKDSYLRYSSEEMFAFVMFFNQEKTNEADMEMKKLTKELIDASLKLRGRYYLPYRLHASKSQFNSCYPNGNTFFKAKKKYDPNEIFQNKFYQTYKTE